ncbi:MAG: Hsp20 family protein [Hyphomicrobiales bacterium]|nr:Hsp20 family protein [Hyphomicrobiales bacterium]
MRHLDLTPLYKSTVGFDRLASMFDSMGSLEGDASNYPPYNIERLDENEYRITMAVAGFSEDDLNIEVKENAVTIRGEHSETEKDSKFLHRGIATRAFERRFQLADHVEVSGAKIEHGLLHVDLVREIPEAMKPRTIDITSGKKNGKVIENKS